MLERDNIKSIVSTFTLRAEYRNLGVTANISRLTEKGNSTFIDYTFTCENATHYLKITLSNQTSTGVITVSNFNSTTKISKSYVSSFTSGLHTSESGRGVKVIFS
jgi:short-subunit dehydrogenase